MKYTKDGIFRRFAFIGFLNEGDAQRAIDKLNKSFIGTSKLAVEQCFDLNDPNRPRPWSKYSTQTQEKVENPTTKNSSTVKKKKNDSSQLVDNLLGDLKNDDKFKQFVRNVDSMKHAEQLIWNDTMQNSDEDEDDHDDENQEEENQEKTKEQMGTNSTAKIEKVKQARFFVKIRGIPYSSKEKDIRQFFSPIPIVHCRLIHNRKTNALTGVCWIELENEDDMKKAMLKQKTIMKIEKSGEHRYLELSSVVKNKELLDAQKNKSIKPLKTYKPVNESIGETGLLFVRNLSYRTTEEELEKLLDRKSVV